MGESETSHPYRPEPPASAEAAPRFIPRVVRVHVLFGAAAGGLFVFIASSILLSLFCRSLDKRFFLLVTAALAVLPAVQLRRGWRNLRLLRRGRVAYATLVTKEELPSGHDDKPTTYRLSFRFEDRGETYTIVKETTMPARLEDDRREQLVFMADDPLGAELVDSLPGQPRILEDNTISAADHAPGATLVMMLLAAAVLVEAIRVYLWLR